MNLFKALQRHFLHFSFLFLFLVGTADSLFTQNGFKSFAFEDPDEKKVTLEFKVLQNLIIIPVFINNSDTLWFILDSGVRNTILLDVPPSDSLQMKGTRMLSLGGLGMGGTLEVLHTWDNKIKIPGMYAEDQDVLVVQDSMFSISTNIGFPVHGIIGHALFKDFVVRINYPYRKLTFYDPETFNPWWRGEKLPIEMKDKKPFLNVPIQFEDKLMHFKLLFDTGAGLSAALFYSEDTPLQIPEPNIEGRIGRGLSGNMTGKLARVESIQMGKFELKDPILTFPDSLSVNIDLKPEYHIGIIGADIIKRFNVYISYSHKAMWIRRNRFFNDRFRYNTSGVEVFTPFPSLPVYKIEKVRPGSVGQQAGLMAGDRIITIEGESAYELSLNDITRMLSQDPGKRIKMTIKREQKMIPVKFRIKEEI